MKNNMIFSNIKGDILGGITAGIVAFPLAIAFGVSSGLGAQYGLYGAIFISIFSALFGGTPSRISGPTAPITALSMVIIAGIVSSNKGDLSQSLPLIVGVFLLTGIFQLILGVLGVGKYIRFIPYPVVSGFMTAIGIIIIVTQLQPALGYDVKQDKELIEQYTEKANSLVLENVLEKNKTQLADRTSISAQIESISQEDIAETASSIAQRESKGVIGTFKVLPRAIQDINWLELILALSTILIVYGFRRITKKIPSELIALLFVSSVAYFSGINYRQIQEIPNSLPQFQTSFFTQFEVISILPYVMSAFTLAILGAIDSLLTSVVADNLTKSKHNPSKELIGQGIGNSVAALFAGLPGAGATVRTVVNINAGGRTKLSGIIVGLFLFSVLMLLGPIASKIPLAVLAGLLITVGISIIDTKGIKAIPYLQKDMKIGRFSLSSEVLIMLSVTFLSSFWNLIYAVGIGLIFASLSFMKKIGDLTGKKSDIYSLNQEATDDRATLEKMSGFSDLLIIKINGPLFFGSSSNIQTLAKKIPKDCKTLAIQAKRLDYIDQSGLYVLEEILLNLTKNNTEIAFIGLPNQPQYMMEKIDIIPTLVPESRVFDSFESFNSWIDKKN